MAPLRALKTDEDIAAIPLDQEILIELPGTAIEEDPKAPVKPGKVAAEEPIVDGAKVLQDALEASQAAAQRERDRADKAVRDAADARRLVAEANKRSHTLEGDVITGGLAAAQAEREAAKLAFQNAGEAGDFKGMADAQDRIARSAARILNFEAGAAEIADRRPEAQQEQVLQQPRDFADQVRANPKLLRSEQDWMIKHKDSFSDPDFNKKLEFAYAGAMQQRGLVRGSQAYFDYMERSTGLIADDGSNDRDNNQGSRDVQAPVTRNERNNDGGIPTKFNYDPETRAFIRGLGITEKEYAINQQRLAREKQVDPDKYR